MLINTDLSRLVLVLSCAGFRVVSAKPDYRGANGVREMAEKAKLPLPPPQCVVWIDLPTTSVLLSFQRVAQVVWANFPREYFEITATTEGVWVRRTEEGLGESR